MSGFLSEEHELLRQTVRDLAAKVVAPRAAEIDRTASYPWDVKEAFARHDLLGLSIPQEFGGVGADRLATCLAIEEVARVCASSSLIVAVQDLGCTPIVLAGTDEQKRRFLPSAAAGEHLAAFALTEPSSGSDAAAMSSRAVRRGDEYILNGTKNFTSNASVAHLYCVFTITDPARGTRGITAFVVERDTPGFEVTRLEEKMGIRGSPTGQLRFEECRIPAANRLGAEGDGFKIAMQTLDRTRCGIAAQAIGIAQGALDCAVAYAKERVQFGQPIAQFQGIQFMLADMAMQVEAARQLTYRAAVEAEAAGPDMTRLSAMAKCLASDVAMRVTTDAVQVLGGYGYLRDFPVERMMRDAKITQIYEGTNQIQRLVIARALLTANPGGAG
ncbi:MAG: acyl-CoA dehydrogenase [Chloroflexi bacterium]|nr:acyl-CoA dehydrogenase [Chloroflexota bacterium]